MSNHHLKCKATIFDKSSTHVKTVHKLMVSLFFFLLVNGVSKREKETNGTNDIKIIMYATHFILNNIKKRDYGVIMT